MEMAPSHGDVTLTWGCHPHMEMAPSHGDGTLTWRCHPHTKMAPSHGDVTLTLRWHPHMEMAPSHGDGTLTILKGTPNFTTSVWNDCHPKIIMDQHVSISKFKTMLKSYLLVSSFTLTSHEMYLSY